MSVCNADNVLSSSAAQSRSNSTNRREKTRAAFRSRTWLPLNNKHHDAPRRPASTTAARHHGSSRSPHLVTISATTTLSDRKVAAAAFSRNSTSATQRNPNTWAMGAAADSRSVRTVDAGPSRRWLSRHFRNSASKPGRRVSGDMRPICCSRNCSAIRWPLKPAIISV